MPVTADSNPARLAHSWVAGRGEGSDSIRVQAVGCRWATSTSSQVGWCGGVEDSDTLSIWELQPVGKEGVS